MIFEPAIVHTIIVLCIFALLVVKTSFPSYTYMFVFIILSMQLFLVYTSYSTNYQHEEHFYDDALATLHTIDTSSMQKLLSIPTVIKSNISEGIQTLIDNGNSNDKVDVIQASDSQYKDIDVRKAYKHINYFLEKVKHFDTSIYETIVPS